MPGFVVGWASETLVVPLDPTQPATLLPYLWVLDDAVSPPIVRRVALPTEAVELGAPPCVCPEIEGACDSGEPIVDVLEPGSSVPALPGSDCACMTDGATFCDVPTWAVPSDYGASYEPGCACGESSEDGYSTSAASLVGGILYTAGDGHEGTCAGYNIYYSIVERIGLVATPVPNFPEPELVSCDPDSSGLPVRMQLGWCREVDGLWIETAEDESEEEEVYESSESCWPCEGVAGGNAQAELHGIARGRWWRVGWSFMEQARAVDSTTLTPALCPSAADPCGDPDGFPALADTVELDQDDWWVATDGSAALFVDDGEIAIALPGVAEPTRHEDRDTEGVLGVRFHHDVRPILEAYQRSLTGDQGGSSLGDESASCVRDGDCGAGAICDRAVCHAACDDDQDCSLAGICGGFCHVATGRCVRWTDGACDGAHDCPPGGECGPAGECADWVGTFAPEDASFDDRRGGRGWGNRCFAHIGAGNLDAAQAACLRGLDEAEATTTQAAILYNLGLIAEARGWPSVAAERYQASLELRENATVRERYDATRADGDGDAYGYEDGMGGD